MSAASCLLTEDQFLCSICLDVFTDPVTTPCGHNFCKSCITEHWETSTKSQCPNCNEDFNTKPELRVNTLLSEMVAQFRQSAQQEASSSSSEQQVSKPGEVLCDVGTGTKLKALKFCLVCLACLCMLCIVTDHRTHDVVPLKEKYERKYAELRKTESDIQWMIQMRRLKIEEIKLSVELSNKNADREMADGVQVFTALMETVEQGLNNLMDMVKEKQRETEKQAEGFIKELQQEISEQNFRSLNFDPPTMDWTGVRVHPPSYEGTVVRAVKQLEETLREEMKKLNSKVELKRVQQYEVDVTLDPDTAHPRLILSDDGKQVHCGDLKKNVPDNPERFSNYAIVLAKQSFSSGRFYFEVQVKEKTFWTLGVAKESINRKGEIPLSPEDGLWTIWKLNENEYKALADPSVRLSLQSGPEKVGVFVDYEEGLVSFYDVDAAALIYSFTGCSFTEKLYPYFSPSFNLGGKNSAPLIISPVSHTE